MKVKHVLMIAAVLLALLIAPVAADDKSADTSVSLSSAAEYEIDIPTNGVNLNTGSATASAGIKMTTIAPGSLIELSIGSGDDGFKLIHTYDSQYVLEYTVTADDGAVTSGDLILSADAGKDELQSVELSFDAILENLPAAGNYKDTLTFTAKERVPVVVSTHSDLILAASNGEYVALSDDLTGPADLSSSYGKTAVVVKNGAILDGNGHTLAAVDSVGTWDCVVNVGGTGGTVKNIKITDGFRGIFLTPDSGGVEIIVEDVVLDGVTYTIHTDNGNGATLTVKDSTLKGWTSYASTLSSASFTKCNFGEGNSYAFCRPYAPTLYDGCNFEAGFEMDLRAACTFTNCYLNGVLIDATNIGDLVKHNPEMATVMNS